MTVRNCCGIDPFTGQGVSISFDSRIVDIAPALQSGGVFVAPGWIDLQVNGFAGVDYNHPQTPLEEIAHSIRALHATGVVRFYPTVITASPGDMEGSLRNLARGADELPEGEAIAGFHVEGPHISPEDGPRGAHPRRWVRAPDFDEFRRWQDSTGNRIRIVTLAPEWPSAPRYIERIVEEGVVAAIGHTEATTAQIAAAVSAGATLSTHLGNGAHAVLRRHPNYIWDQLAEDRLMADFIADGIHLDASFLKVALRAKGVERSVLVTDAAPPAGAAPGRYRLGEQEVDLTGDGRVVLAGPAGTPDRLAGSALRMDHGIANLIRLAGLSLADAVRMATVNAARAGRVPGAAAGRERRTPADRAPEAAAGPEGGAPVSLAPGVAAGREGGAPADLTPGAALAPGVAAGRERGAPADLTPGAALAPGVAAGREGGAPADLTPGAALAPGVAAGRERGAPADLTPGAALAPGVAAGREGGVPPSLAPGVAAGRGSDALAGVTLRASAKLNPGPPSRLEPGAPAGLKPGTCANLAPGATASPFPAASADVAPGAPIGLRSGAPADPGPGVPAALEPGVPTVLEGGTAVGLAHGARADLVQFRFDPAEAHLEIISTWLAGRQVFP